LAWILIPLKVTWIPYSELVLRSWRLFVFACGVPSLLIAITLHAFFPETPKFLLSQGRHDEALAVLRQIFVINKRKNPAEYCVIRQFFPLRDEITVFFGTGTFGIPRVGRESSKYQWDREELG
jgi:Sugar (and other) transporter